MKVQRLRYYGGSSMPFLGDYTLEDYELKCECGNDEKELPGHSNAMSAVKSTSYNKNAPCWCIHNLPVPAPKPVNGTHVGNETTW